MNCQNLLKSLFFKCMHIHIFQIYILWHVCFFRRFPTGEHFDELAAEAYELWSYDLSASQTWKTVERGSAHFKLLISGLNADRTIIIQSRATWLHNQPSPGFSGSLVDLGTNNVIKAHKIHGCICKSIGCWLERENVCVLRVKPLCFTWLWLVATWWVSEFDYYLHQCM